MIYKIIKLANFFFYNFIDHLYYRIEFLKNIEYFGIVNINYLKI